MYTYRYLPVSLMPKGYVLSGFPLFGMMGRELTDNYSFPRGAMRQVHGVPYH
jgi:hypothetical protein